MLVMMLTPLSTVAFSSPFDLSSEFLSDNGFHLVCPQWSGLLTRHSTGVYAHQERAAGVADSCKWVGSQPQLIVVLPGTALKSGGDTEGQCSG
jgi:hypothetical protein